MFRKMTLALSAAAILLASAALAARSTAAVNKVSLTALSATPTPPVVGTNAAISFSVKSLVAKQALSGVPWTLTDNGVEVAKGTIDLAAGATVTGGAEWMPTGGVHSLKLSIDPLNTLGEASTGSVDNSKTLKFSLEINKVSVTDLSATPLPTGDALAPAVAGEDAGVKMEISFSVENLGTTATGGIAWKLTDNGVEIAQGEMDIAAGSTETTRAEWLADAGAHALKISIDAKNALGEAGTGLADNSKSLPLTL